MNQLIQRRPTGGLESSIIKYLGTRVFLKGIAKLGLDLFVSTADGFVFLGFASALRVTNYDQLWARHYASAFCGYQRLE